jgi:hypothetical protein
MSTVTEQRIGCFPMPADEYHADKSAWSRTMIADFRKRRSVCYARHILGTAPEDRSNHKIDLGDLAHVALLEPHRLETDYVCYPPEILAKNGAVSTNEAKAFRAKHEATGKTVMKIDDFLVVAAMIKSVKAKCGELITPDARIEHAIYWQDESGLMCRCRPDVLVVRPDFALAIDIKSTADVTPEEFKRRIEGNGYLLQDSHYSEGIRRTFKVEPRFLFAAVETEWPHACAIYEIRQDDRATGWATRRETMRQIATCVETGDWSDSWEQTVNIVSLSKRALE